MTAPRSKLLVLKTRHVDLAALEQALGGQFEIVAIEADAASRCLEAAGGDLVLGCASDYLPLEREIVTGQSSMLLNSIGEGVALFERDGQPCWSNRSFEELDDSIRGRISRVVAKALAHFDARLGREGREALPGPRTGPTKRYQIQSKRSHRHYEVRVWPVLGPRQGESGLELRRVAAVVRDVTSRSRMQQRMDAIDRAGRELIHLDVGTIKKLHAAERLRLLEERVIKSAHDLLHFDNFAVRMVKPATGLLELVMAAGLPEAARRIRIYAKREDNGISGYVAATGKSYICPDVSQDNRYVLGIDNPGSSLTVPLKLFDKVIGVFNAESNRRGAFSDADRQFAEIFANYIAMALHILNLLLVERWTTSESATGTVRGELKEPLDDLAREAELLLDRSSSDDDSSHLRRILKDVSSIRRRMKSMASGPRSLLGVEEAIERGAIDQELAGRRVLVVDDEEEIVQIVRDVLTARGCQVTACTTGEEALRYITLESTISTEGAMLLGSHPLSLVISDINIDDATGYDIFAAAKEASTDLPVILMTGFGYDPHHSIVRASQEGLQCVLFKPFQAERLVDEVKRAIFGAEAELTGEESKDGSRDGSHVGT